MNREDIIRMAQEAGMVHDEDDDSFFSPSNLGVDVHINNLERFASIVVALEAKDEPVAHSVVAGALFDFMGWLTSREKRLILSSVDEASPAVEAITEFAKKRNLSLKYAEVGYWMEFLSTPPQQEAKDEPVAWISAVTGDLTAHDMSHTFSWAPLYTTPPQRKPLTDEEIRKWWASENGLEDCDMCKIDDFILVARAIEAKLKEKNT